jgi:hypothetical protein
VGEQTMATSRAHEQTRAPAKSAMEAGAGQIGEEGWRAGKGLPLRTCLLGLGSLARAKYAATQT